MTGIYKVTNPDGAAYIGQSRNIEQRFNSHKNVNHVRNLGLKSSLQFFGIKAHSYEIIHQLPDDVTVEVLNNYESLYLEQYKEIGAKLFNIRAGGSTGKHAQSSIDKMAGSNGMWMVGRKLSAESIAKRTAKTLGVKRSQETKKKLSVTKLGELNPRFGKPAWNKGILGSTKKKTP